MKGLLFVLILSVLACGKKKEETAQAISKNINEPFKLEVYDFNGIENFLKLDDDKVHVVNFWATWCVPCVKELPHFESLNEEFKKRDVEVLLISLDFPKQYDSKLIPFVEKHKLKSKVIALDDTDMNTWLPKIDEDWSGAIPATLIYAKGKRKFYEQSFTYEELIKEVKQFIK